MSAATALPSRVRAVMALQSCLMDRCALSSGSAGPPGSAGAGAGTHMHPLPLRAVEAEDLGGLGAGVAEPVRGVGVELGHLTGGEDHIMLAEHQANPAGQHVEPFVALVGAQVRLVATPGR